MGSNLQQFAVTIMYRPGITNQNADGLSRQVWQEDKVERTDLMMKIIKVKMRLTNLLKRGEMSGKAPDSGNVPPCTDSIFVCVSFNIVVLLVTTHAQYVFVSSGRSFVVYLKLGPARQQLVQNVLYKTNPLVLPEVTKGLLRAVERANGLWWQRTNSNISLKQLLLI